MPRPQFTTRRKQCMFCRKKLNYIDFKDVNILTKFLSPWNKVKAGRDTGTCSRHQRMLTDAMKRARYMALLPYVKR